MSNLRILLAAVSEIVLFRTFRDKRSAGSLTGGSLLFGT